MNHNLTITNVKDIVCKLFNANLLNAKNFNGYFFVDKEFGIVLHSKANDEGYILNYYIKPPPNMFKLNSDIFAKGVCGCGGIILNYSGNFAISFSTALPTCSIIYSELLLSCLVKNFVFLLVWLIFGLKLMHYTCWTASKIMMRRSIVLNSSILLEILNSFLFFLGQVNSYS
ncbi:hypothetical protein KFK09_001814 [Dendrobium nobile]|uniref:Uncharacterized protein n=1 Tax=Dendrobium nobile TaxID=94219 RepID=A0A8T3C8F5_DENNO|nr:hypothetical protein KFK09_001814 [Dendrobium nobile]